MSDTPKHHWSKYSPRTLLVFITVCAILCSWLAVKTHQERRQEHAVEATQVLDKEMTEGKSQNNGFVRRVDLSNSQVTDAGLEYLRGLPQLTELNLSGTQVSDAGLEYLKGLRYLERLYLNGTRVSDVGLEYLKRLPELKCLGLGDTRVSDGGLKNLKCLSQPPPFVSQRHQNYRRGAGISQRTEPPSSGWALATPKSLTLDWNISKG